MKVLSLGDSIDNLVEKLASPVATKDEDEELLGPKVKATVHEGADCKVVFRLRLFRLNLISGNQFPENRAFGCAGKFGQTENIFSLTGK